MKLRVAWTEGERVLGKSEYEVADEAHAKAVIAYLEDMRARVLEDAIKSRSRRHDSIRLPPKVVD